MTDTEKLIEREIRNAREGADYLRVAASRLDRLYDPEGVAKQHMENGAGYLDRAATALSAQQREIAELREALRPALDMCITYAGFIKDHVRADDVEVHPYLPWLEDVINDARATLAALNTPSQEGEKR